MLADIGARTHLEVGENPTADGVSMFCWNVSNRVGRTTFRPEAAASAMETGVDVLVFNEFFSGPHLAHFQATLSDHGWFHQAMSEWAGAKANRVLVASRVQSKFGHLAQLPRGTRPACAWLAPRQ